MALTENEEIQLRDLLTGKVQLDGLIDNYASILSKLGASQVTLADLGLITDYAIGDETLVVRSGTAKRLDVGALVGGAGAYANSKLYAAYTGSLDAVTGAIGDYAVVVGEAGTHTDPVTAATVSNKGMYQWSASPAGWKWISALESISAQGSADLAQAWAESSTPPDPDDATSKSAKTIADEMAAKTSALVATIDAKADADSYGTSRLFGLGGRLTQSINADFARGFLVGTDIAALRKFNVIDVPMAVPAATSYLVLKLWKRASGGDFASPPGSAAGDAVALTQTLPIASSGITAGGTIGFVRFDAFGDLDTGTAGGLIIVEVDAYNASNARTTLTYQFANTGSSATYRGWARANAVSGFGTIGTNFEIAMDISAKVRRSSADASAQQRSAANKGKGALRWTLAGARYGFHQQTFNLYKNAAITYGGMAAVAVVGTAIPADAFIGRTVVLAQVDVSTSYIMARAYLRPPGASLTAVGIQATDKSVGVRFVPNVSGGEKYFAVDINWPELIDTGAAGGMLIVTYEAFTAAGAQTRLTLAPSSDYIGTDATQNGWYRTTTSTASWTNLNGWTVGWQHFMEAAPAQRAEGQRILACEASVAGYTVTLDAARSAIGNDGLSTPMSGAVTLTAPTTGSVIDEAGLILKYISGTTDAGPGFINTPTAVFTHGNISNVVIKDTGGTTLLEGAAGGYDLNRQVGAAQRFDAGSDITATASYTYSRERCDVICWDVAAGALAVVVGTEGDRDAAERIPAVTNMDLIPLFHAFVVAGRVTLQPVWRASQGVAGFLDQTIIRQDMIRAQRVLPKTLAKLRQGITPKIAFYGTSIFNLGGGGSQTVPNGTSRDVPSFFTAYSSGGAIGSDIISALPLFDHADGAGQVHSHVGAHWTLASFLNQLFGVKIGIVSAQAPDIPATTLLNMAISGSATGTGTNGANLTTRINGLIAQAPDCVVIDMSANENISSAANRATTRSNIAAILSAFRAAGIECIVLGSWLKNAQFKFGQYRAYQQLNTALRQAAEFGDAAFVDISWLYGDDGRQMLGVDPSHWGAANIAQHPGLRELDRAGRLIAYVMTGA